MMVSGEDALLAPAKELPPYGPNLEHDLTFFELEAAAKGKPEQRVGDVVKAAEEPKWDTVLEASQTLLARSKDLRIAAYLIRALTRTDGIPGLMGGLDVIRGLLEQYWDGVHPVLEADHDNDPTERLNALASLADPAAVLGDLRDVYLVNSREHGQLRVRDVEIALGRLAPVRTGAVAPAKTLAQIHTQIAAAFASDRAIPASLRTSRETVQNIQTFVNDRIGARFSFDLKPLTVCLDTLLEACDSALGGDSKVGIGVRTGAGNPAGQSQDGLSAVSLGEIHSREEALRALDLVCGYLERHDQSNPAPLFIRRAQRLMRKNFVEIVKDLIPDSLSNLERLAGGFEEKK